MSLELRLTTGAIALLASLSLAPSSGGAQTGSKPPLATMTVGVPSNVDLVNRALNPGASDPNVPLPHPSLSAPPSPPVASAGTQIYGRQEEGGAVLGLRVAIPADRGSGSANTRYSGGAATSDGRLDSR